MAVWQEPDFFGYEKKEFTFAGRQAILVFPKKADKEKNWMLKTEYFGAFPGVELALLERGFHLAYLTNKNRWGVDEDQDAKAAFAAWLHKEYGLCEKCVPVGMSCGGLHAVRLALRHPETVKVLYLDAPVMNFLSCPAGFGVGESLSGNTGMQELIDAYGFTPSALITYREHPIDQLPRLFATKIPIVLIYGDSDVTVPYVENGALLEQYYRQRGADLLVIGKKGCGHHPHGLADCTPIVDFILQRV